MANKERIGWWIAALRSGSYEQVQGVLKSVTVGPDGTEVVGYCCLGVATEVYLDNVSDIVNTPDVFAVPSEEMHTAVWDWYGLSKEEDSTSWNTWDPIVGHDDEGERIGAINANDDHRWPFTQIADALEKRYITDAP